MFELLTLFLTGGGSAAMGSILKGVFGAVTDARSQKHEMEMARECRNNENAIQFQQALSNVPGGAFTRATRDACSYRHVHPLVHHLCHHHLPKRSTHQYNKHYR